MKIKKGDNVIVTAGKDRGREGKIIRVLPKENKVVIEGLNLLKRRLRPKKSGEKGQTAQIAYPLAAAKVMVKCGRCGRGTRIGYQLAAKKKIRICRRCRQPL
ncbi:MAG TPA: 50S ribosomal protein L24 [Candidatus Paceibacterota bacterium]